MILDLHRQGLTVSAIARALGVDRKTVRRCITRGLETPMLEKRLAAEILEVRILHPAIAQSLVGRVVGVLEDR